MTPDSTKEKERGEVHRAIWAIADELRGAVDGWDFKNYILGTMFYRYISESITDFINANEWASGNEGFDYSRLPDEEAESTRDDLVQSKGFFILPSELFANVRASAMSDPDLNMTLQRIFRNIEDSAKSNRNAESKFAGLFDDFDVNSNKLGSSVPKRNERLRKLLDGVADMNLGSVREHSIDALGDAYEYLMAMYASNAGKSGGEFFTPADVSELLTRLGTVGKTRIDSVYDPACGSGSLLLRAMKVLGRDGVALGFYGQEINITTYNLCRMNMFLHNINYAKFSIQCDDTLIHPKHWDNQPFELIVSNPPYSIKWAGDDNAVLINDPRFSPAGVLAPKSKADFAFIMHSLSWLAENGTAAIVCFPGIMYRGGAEQKIRQYLVENNFIDAVIQLPDNLFFGASIATCILVMKKNKTDNSILFIDAGSECVKVTNSNRLTDENIANIIGAYTAREDREYFCRLAGREEVAREGYNLSVSTYVEKKDTREIVDIRKLNDEIRVIVVRQVNLRGDIEEIILRIEAGDLEELIARLCPDGVTFMRMGDIATYERPDDYIVTGTDYSDDYPVPVLTAGHTFILGYTDETEGIYPASTEDPVIIFDDFTGAFKWVDFPFKVKSSAMKILKANRDITSLRYIFHIMSWLGFSSSEHRRLWISKYSDFRVPVPPIEVQEAIVNILDKFTELNKELNKELVLRRKQYEYYRDKLLNFSNSTHKGGGIKCLFVKLSDIATITRGGTFQKKDFVPDGKPCIHYGQIHTHYGVHASRTLSYVSSETFDRSRKAQPGDIVMATTSEDVEGVCKCVAWLGDEPVAVSGHTVIIHHEQDAKYLSFFFQSEMFRRQKKKMAHGVKVVEVAPDKLGDTIIPIPPIERQKYIADILDRFDRLINDLSDGLPAEIGARKKQYEYYRDTLLAFEEKKP